MGLWGPIASQNVERVECSVSPARCSVGLGMCRKMSLAFIRRIIDLATKYVRYGYRRITMMLREEGCSVHHKRIERLWCQEDLRSLGSSRSVTGCS